MTDDFFRLDGGGSSLILHCRIGDPPCITYWGREISRAVDKNLIASLGLMQAGPGSADEFIEASMAMEPGLGLSAPWGFSAHRNGRDWGSRFVVTRVLPAPQSVEIYCGDPKTSLALVYIFRMDAHTGVLQINSSVKNTGDDALDLVEMATATVPIPERMTDIIGFSGRWSHEFQTKRFALQPGGYIRENRRGRTSHDSFPALILCEASTTENQGAAYGLHLAWSGNHRIRVEALNDNRVLASLGVLLWPGEIRLQPGETFACPEIVAAYTFDGLTSLSQKFHRHVQDKLLRSLTRQKLRPVHYNSWEAVYFDHDVDKLKDIASRAAAIGIERFVLDDGWFGARRDDRAGLGDWFVSSDVYPDGLAPLIKHVTALGMEMGIWFEPEMVNPDSDLYRAHPDWVLQVSGVEQVPFRNQYVLDISRQEVSDYLFERVDSLLSNHDLSYVKWDMNRDLNHPGDASGHPRAAAQVSALYSLLDRLREKHPHVEIESCASGGARPDYGILAHTDRIWTSDTNDALHRQNIQRGASFFLPLCIMGSHVGPRQCHTTGRVLPMALRAATAMMGHMGAELNLLTEPAAELAELASAIDLYKNHRALLHSGHFYRVDTRDHLNMVGVAAPDKSEAIFSVAWLTANLKSQSDRIYFAGLDPKASYRLTVIWPTKWHAHGAASALDVLDMMEKGTVIPGDVLINAGLQLPLAWPESVLIFHLRQER